MRCNKLSTERIYDGSLNNMEPHTVLTLTSGHAALTLRNMAGARRYHHLMSRSEQTQMIGLAHCPGGCRPAKLSHAFDFGLDLIVQLLLAVLPHPFLRRHYLAVAFGCPMSSRCRT